jgi:hypothetical protein
MELRWKSRCNARPSVTSRQHTASRLTGPPRWQLSLLPPVYAPRPRSRRDIAWWVPGLARRAPWVCCIPTNLGGVAPVPSNGARTAFARGVVRYLWRWTVGAHRCAVRCSARRRDGPTFWRRGSVVAFWQFRGFVACARSADLGGCPDSARAGAAGAAGDHPGTTGPPDRPRTPGRPSRVPCTHSPLNRSETRRMSIRDRRGDDRSCSRRARLSGRSRRIHSPSQTLGAGLHQTPGRRDFSADVYHDPTQHYDHHRRQLTTRLALEV